MTDHKLSEIDQFIISPALAYLNTYIPLGPAAKGMLLTIGLTESNFTTRLQKPIPYAKGFWQFEKEGGCREFELLPKLQPFRDAAKGLFFPTRRLETWTALGNGADLLAVIMARALIWLEPNPLPKLTDREGMYRQYLSRWRPGKPSKTRWNASHKRVLEYLTKHVSS